MHDQVPAALPAGSMTAAGKSGRLGQILQLDLAADRAILVQGYPSTEPDVLDGRIRAELRYQAAHYEFFVWGTFFGCSRQELLAWLESFSSESVGGWAASVSGDFNVVAWDRASRRALAISDRVGAHRLYVHCSNAVATFSDRLFDQARIQANPELNSDAVLTLLTFGYPLDPNTLLRDTSVITVGDFATCTEEGTVVSSYYEPVQLKVDNFNTVEECLDALDQQFRATFARQTSKDVVPLVMLSGGIDSVLMLRYLSEVAHGPVETLTYATHGQAYDELAEARIASGFYGSRHHTVVLSSTELCDFTRRTLAETDNNGYGGIQAVAVADFLRNDGRQLDVFRGEDTRLHTPSLDLPTRLGLWANRNDRFQNPVLRELWNSKAVLKRWPIRRGRNYLSYLSDKMELCNDLPSYVLASMARFHYPPSFVGPHTLPSGVLEELSRFPDNGDLEQLFRWAVSLAYRLQYTDNMHDGHAQCDTLHSRLRMPFYDPDVVAVSNRVPLSIGLKTMLVNPKRTRSPFPVVDKFVLRKLLEGAAPPELIYRRKSTAPAMDVHYRAAGRHVIVPAVRHWGPPMLAALPADVRIVASAYCDDICAAEEAGGDTWALGAAGLNLFYLSALHWLTEHSTEDLDAALRDLDPGVDLRT